MIVTVLTMAVLPTPLAASSISVTTTLDVIADDGLCSLREAVVAANVDAPSGLQAGECAAGNGADDISLPPGTYVLSIGGTTDEAGDFDIRNDLTIDGEGPASTVIDGAGLDRVFDVHGAEVRLSNLTVRNGSASEGGGIRSDGTLALETVAVEGNRATDGGGIFNAGGSLTVTATTVSSNSASKEGGGVFNGAGGTLKITNSTISGNIAGSAGGGFRYGASGSVVVEGSTISNNRAATGGGVSGATGSFTIVNTIVAGNPEGGNCAIPGTASSLGHNLADDGTCGLSGPSDLTVINARLGRLQDYGGPTKTHGLGEGSPAIDAGGDASAPPMDQRGVARPLGAASDIGSYEVVAGRPIPEQWIVAGLLLAFSLVRLTRFWERGDMRPYRRK